MIRKDIFTMLHFVNKAKGCKMRPSHSGLREASISQGHLSKAELLSNEIKVFKHNIKTILKTQNKVCFPSVHSHLSVLYIP